MRAELRGIVEGMKLAWEKGIHKLLIHTDSLAAVEMLFNFDDYFDPPHLPRSNSAVDYLANLGHSLGLGVHVFDVPDVSLSNRLRFDLFGGCIYHFILNNT
ncbi:hypothetical protein LINPERPRIM_LOCUS38102 [Linum perenne]